MVIKLVGKNHPVLAMELMGCGSNGLQTLLVTQIPSARLWYSAPLASVRVYEFRPVRRGLYIAYRFYSAHTGPSDYSQ